MSDKDKPSLEFFNRGKRVFDLGFGEDNKPRRFAPGSRMLLTAAEAKHLAGYPEVIELSKMPASEDSRKLKDDNARLAKENEELHKKLEALSKPSDPKGNGK